MSCTVCLTGYMGSGKGEVMKMLTQRGFTSASLSDAVRAEATAQGAEHTRENLQKMGNELRQKHGPGVLGRRIREMIEMKGGEQWVVDGIRNPAEWRELSVLPHAELLGITASDDVLIDRLMARKREGEAPTREEIRAKIEKEKGVVEPPEGQQVRACLEVCDFLIINEGTLDELMAKLNHFLRLGTGEDRPSFHEIFMEIAYTWAKRATCLRRKVGAVIAKDKQQLTSGYNGAPRGVPHCAEAGGCLRIKLGIPSGQRHEICRGTHAEQNAITQAAKLGINIDGGTLYCNCFPCVICTKMILNAGIATVVYDCDYDDPLSKEILAQQSHVRLERYEGKKFRV